MPYTRGIDLRVGFRREATTNVQLWPASAAVALAALLPILDVQGNDGIEKQSYADVRSGLGPVGFDIVSKQPSATLPLKLVYQGLEQLWACALGQAPVVIGATTFPELITTGVYRHLFELSPRLSTVELWEAGQGQAAGARKVRRGTLAVDYQTEVGEWLSCMVQSLTLQVGLGRPTLTVELLSYSLSRASVINTSVTMAQLFPVFAPNVLPHEWVWRVAPYSAGTPLGSSNVAAVTSWTLRLDNNLVTSFGPAHGLAPDEYERSGVPRITLTFVLPRHVAATWHTRWGDNTTVMADGKFTSDTLITAGQPYRLNLYVPSAKVTSAQLETSGPRLPPDTVQLIATIPTAAAAGFPTMSQLTPFAAEVYSGVSTHSLVG